MVFCDKRGESYSWSKINFILGLSFMSETSDSKRIIGFRSQYVFSCLSYDEKKVSIKETICLGDGCLFRGKFYQHWTKGYK